MTTQSTESARTLRNLYLVRTFFQLIWAGLLLTHPTIPTWAAVLLTVYPLWDVACTVYDLKTSGEAGDAARTQVINIVLGLATSVAIGLTVSSQPRYSIAAFGAWALLAGLLQLAVGVSRRKALGGQWAMILSGAQSTLAGAAFVLGGLNGKFHAKDLGGYAVFGAVYFLVGAVLLSRKISRVVWPRDGSDYCHQHKDEGSIPCGVTDEWTLATLAVFIPPFAMGPRRVGHPGFGGVTWFR